MASFTADFLCGQCFGRQGARLLQHIGTGHRFQGRGGRESAMPRSPRENGGVRGSGPRSRALRAQARLATLRGRRREVAFMRWLAVVMATGAVLTGVMTPGGAGPGRSAQAATGPQQAVATSTFIDSIGVNTHIDFIWLAAYANLKTTIDALAYLGVRHLRDDPLNPADVGPNGWWQRVANATRVKFDAFMAEGGVAQMRGDLARAQQLAGQGLLDFIEGGNEEDDPYAQQHGNSLEQAAAFQREVYRAGRALGLPVINMSFGQGWTAANDWRGNYDKVGDLSAYADYANAHTYPDGAPLSKIRLLNRNARLAAPHRPVIMTEFGYDTRTTDPVAAARHTVAGLLDSYKEGDVKTYVYALFDDDSGKFGMMNADGTSKPAGTAVHNLIALLRDHGAEVARPGTLDIALGGAQPGDDSLLMQGDGVFWLALWNETAGTHTVTLSLHNGAGFSVFDPVTGTGAIQTAGDANSLAVRLGNNPLLIQITPEA
jgi:hypothetical protein